MLLIILFVSVILHDADADADADNADADADDDVHRDDMSFAQRASPSSS